jgi:hypothetical protein
MKGVPPAFGALTPESVAALNNRVDLRIDWAEHGLPFYSDPVNHGRTQAVVESLDPLAGDMLVVEGRGFYAQPTPETVVEKLREEAVLYGVLSKDSAVSPTHETLEALQQKHLITAFDSAFYLANFRGLQVAYADITGWQAAEWQQYMRARARASAWRFLGSVGTFVGEDIITSLSEKEYRQYRESHAAQCLGELALGFPLPDPEKRRPIMAVLWGKAHQEAFEQRLRDAGVVFTSEDITPESELPTRGARLIEIGRGIGRRYQASRVARRILRERGLL